MEKEKYARLQNELDRKIMEIMPKTIKTVFRLRKVSSYDEQLFLDGKRLIEEYYEENQFDLDYLQARKYYLQTKSVSYYSLMMPVILSLFASAFGMMIFNEKIVNMILGIFKGIKIYYQNIFKVHSESMGAYISSGIQLALLLFIVIVLIIGTIGFVAWAIRIISIYGVEGGSYEREFLKQYEIEYIDELCDKIKSGVTQYEGYQIKYATNRKFKHAKKMSVRKSDFTKDKVEKSLLSNSCYFKIREYKKMEYGNKELVIYSNWSEVVGGRK